MTMAPGQKKRGFLLELIFISILVFLLIGARSQTRHQGAVPNLPTAVTEIQGTLFGAPASLK
jgi:hypothetical protein